MAVTALPRISLKKVLLATDFSECSRAILPYARNLALQYDSELFLAHIIPPEMIGLEANSIESLEKTALREMEDLESDEHLKGLRHTHIIKSGEIWTALGEIVVSQGIELVILGTHGRTGLKKIVMGSVAEAILRSAPCPVLTIGPKTTADHDDDGIVKHVLCAVDPGSRNLYAELLATGFAQRQDGRLTLIHVTGTKEDADRARSALQLIASRIKLNQPPDVIVVTGEAVERILQAAAERQVDLIVLGVDRPNLMTSHLSDLAFRVVYEAPVSALMTGDWQTDFHVAYRVVCEGHCPVLTVGVEAANLARAEH